jgi:N-methylhydantoinase A
MPISTDIGGTFTDFVIFDKGEIRTFKVPSTPHKPELAIEIGLARCSQAPSFSHGTTLATNAVLERKGAKTGLVTTTGFANILNIGRQQRPHLYKLDSSRPKQIVDTKVCFEISERVSAQGEILMAPAQKEIEVVAEQIQAKGVDSVAICFLFSFLNPENEHVVRDSLVKRGLAVSCSSEVLPEGIRTDVYNGLRCVFEANGRAVPNQYGNAVGENWCGAVLCHAVKWRRRQGGGDEA